MRSNRIVSCLAIIALGVGLNVLVGCAELFALSEVSLETPALNALIEDIPNQDDSQVEVDQEIFKETVTVNMMTAMLTEDCNSNFPFAFKVIEFTVPENATSVTIKVTGDNGSSRINVGAEDVERSQQRQIEEECAEGKTSSTTTMTFEPEKKGLWIMTFSETVAFSGSYTVCIEAKVATTVN